MAFTINQSQQLRAGAVYPISAYSRIVSLLLSVNSLWGPTFQYSQTFGNDFWLLGIKVWCNAKVIDTTQVTSVSFRYGVGIPATEAAMRDWEEILPMRGLGGAASNWMLYDGQDSRDWTMSKRFQGQGQRLGVWGARSVNVTDTLQVSFLIAEG